MTNVFGVPIEGWTIGRMLDLLTHQQQEPVWIVTANPEILLEASQDRTYAETLRRATMRTVDGFGLWMVLRFMNEKTSRVSGVDLAERLLKDAEREGWRVGFFGGQHGVAEEAAERQRTIHPRLVVRAEQGGAVEQDGSDDRASEEARRRLTLFDPQVMLVALSFPAQERWIEKHLNDFPTLRIIVGVGGTFDYWSGRVRRAPEIVRRVGLEWMWRLAHQPRRLIRIWRAVVLFPWKVLRTPDHRD